MFKLLDQPTFWWNVDVEIPTLPSHEDGENQTAAHRFRAQFLAVPDKELTQGDVDIPAMLKRVWIGWDDVTGPDDHPIPFSPELRDAQLEILWVRRAVWNAYTDALTTGKARRGN